MSCPTGSLVMTTLAGFATLPARRTRWHFTGICPRPSRRVNAPSEIYVPETHPFLFWARRHDQGMNRRLPPDIQSSQSRLPTTPSAGGGAWTTPRRAEPKGESGRLGSTPGSENWLNPSTSAESGSWSKGRERKRAARQMVCPETNPAPTDSPSPSLPSTLIPPHRSRLPREPRPTSRTTTADRPTATMSSAAARPATPAASSRQGMFQCGLCSSQYKRLDHLSRHVRSRTFAFPDPIRHARLLWRQGWAGILLRCRW